MILRVECMGGALEYGIGRIVHHVFVAAGGQQTFIGDFLHSWAWVGRPGEGGGQQKMSQKIARTLIHKKWTSVGGWLFPPLPTYDYPPFSRPTDSPSGPDFPCDRISALKIPIPCCKCGTRLRKRRRWVALVSKDLQLRKTAVDVLLYYLKTWVGKRGGGI